MTGIEARVGTFLCAVACGLVLPVASPAQVAGPPPGAAAAMGPAAIPALAAGLVEDSRRLGEAARLELGNTPRGQQLRNQAAALSGAAEHLDRATRQRDMSPERRRAALRDVRLAYKPIADDLARPGPGAPAVRRIAERVGLKIASLEAAMQPGPPPVPPGSPYDRAALLAALASTQAATEGLILALKRQPAAPPAGPLAGQLGAWGQQLEAYRQFVDSNRPTLRQAQAGFHPVRNAARGIGQELERARPPAQVVAAWNAALAALDSARVALRLGPEYVENRPVPSAEERVHRALVREYTGMIAEMDTFMAGLSDKVPEGPQIRGEAVTLRDALNRLRRHTAAGVPDRRIVQDLASAASAQQVLALRVERVNQGRAPGPNVLRVRKIGEALARIQAAASGS
jgi:hypothetical protein